jgi:RNA binding exosome subunit
MVRTPFHYVDLRTFRYATESEQRVEAALRHLLPEDAAVEREETAGHHGDPIVVLSARVERAAEIRHVLSVLRESVDIERVRSELEDRVDEDCSLYLTLDKQAAFRGEASLGRGITLRAKVEAYPAERETAVENAREAL